jgi:hypothetical protein
MAFDAHKNFAYATVATAPSPAASGTSLVVAAGQGALFPAVPFNAVICPANTPALWTNAEIVRVTARATDTFTIARSSEATAGARTVLVGDQIFAGLTAKTLSDLEVAPVFTGPVGIGTTSPQNLLSVSNSGAAGIEVVPASGSTVAYSPLGLNGSTLTFNIAGNVAATVDASRRLGLGLAPDGAYKLQIQGEGLTNATRALQIQNSAATTSLYVADDGSGYLRAAAWTYGSDRRLKTNIAYFDRHIDSLAVIRALRPASFDYRDGRPNNRGFVAQDVQAVLPAAVEITDPATGMLGLKTEFIVPYLVGALQQLADRLAAVEAAVGARLVPDSPR